MAILTQFLNKDRFAEIKGCPLGPTGGPQADTSACKACPYNALHPGAASVGCVANTKHRDLQRALEHLGKIDRKALSTVEAMLRRERATPEDQGLTREEAEALAAIAKKWATLLANDPGETQLVLTLLRFAEAAAQSGEPVRVLA